MNTTSRTITGIITIVLGIFLTTISFTETDAIWVLIYGIPIIIIGIFILLNKKEDNIEQIKTQRKGGKRKK